MPFRLPALRCGLKKGPDGSVRPFFVQGFFVPFLRERRGQDPKLSYMMFSAGTPRLSSMFSTDEIIMGGPHIR